ncbi:MAG: (2Fe-2S) ferredoxin domain-containing protein [Gloeomargaritaceae cyanobacterium C42_A2020_066]|nr:(2Fe-2S) ferredoxin domain-containing protein [Gloeomargaritaceae cyanobacterium C42_A2020_066]
MAHVKSAGRILEGRFLEFVGKHPGVEPHKRHHLRVETEQGELVIKVPKYLRAGLRQDLAPGAWVRLAVYSDGDHFKATDVVWTQERYPQPLPQPSRSRTCIQVCQKGTCSKRGSRLVWQAIQASLAGRPLVDQVTVEATGCLKACKAGPNVRIGRVAYHDVCPEQVPQLLAQHFPDPES